MFAISGAMLALTAGLAVTCFAKVFAMGFLGMSRSEGAANATEAPLTPNAWMRGANGPRVSRGRFRVGGYRAFWHADRLSRLIDQLVR